MFFKVQKSWIGRSFLIMALLSGMLGLEPVQAAPLQPNQSQQSTERFQQKSGDSTVGKSKFPTTSNLDNTLPTVIATSPQHGDVLLNNPSTISVQFSNNMLANGTAFAVNKPANYLLVEDGEDGSFQTNSCTGQLAGDDTLIPINRVTYNSVNFTSTLTVLVSDWPVLNQASYQLLVCASTRITDLSGNRLNNGSDSVIRFVVSKELYFYPYTNYGGGDGEAVGIGDFNHDGLTDIVMATASEVLVYLKDGDGNLNTPVAYAGGSDIKSLAVGDFNNDGWDDVVTSNFTSNTISVFLQQSDGTFAPRVTYAPRPRPDTVVAGDLTGDGLADIVASNYSLNAPYSSLNVFVQNTNGGLDFASYDGASAGLADLAIGDVNNDGRNDAVRINTGSNLNLSVYLQNASGTLGNPVSYSPVYVGSGIGIGDVTGDGLSDVVISYGGNRPNSKIAVYAQGLDGSLQPPITYDAYDIPGAVEIADINQDGTLDILVLHGSWQAVSVFLQKNGAIQPYILYTFPNINSLRPQSLAAGDINQDGATDIAIAGDYGLTTLYFHEKSAPQVIMGGNASPVDGEELDAETSQLTVQFDRQMRNDGGTSSVNNPSNYLLVEDGVDDNFQTSSCTGGHAGDDVLMSVDSITYDTSKFFSRLSINGGLPLGAGGYRLFVCGTASIEDVDGAKLNGGLSDTSVTFTVWPTPHTISGNAGVAGAVLAYTDGSSRTVIADGIGDYSFKVSDNWTGTVTPSKANYAFVPASKTYAGVTSDIRDEHYTATLAAFTISGNTGMGSISLYSSPPGAYISSDQNGNYSLTVSSGWTGTIYPSRSGYRFIPTSRSYNNLQSSQANQNFVPERVYTIDGNAGAAGVTLSYVDGTSKSVTSDSGGNYSIQVPEHWSGTITPAKSSHIFTPSSRSYTDIVANQPSENYAATILVTNTNDSGPGSLRQAIVDATSGATIYFDTALGGQAITLGSQLDIDKNLTIDGSGLDPRVSISGNNAVRIFSINPNYALGLESLILRDGKTSGTSTAGGAIETDVHTVLTATDVKFIGNSAYQGGAIFGSGLAVVTILRCEFISNSAQGTGGAIDTGSNITIKDSIFTSNHAGGDVVDGGGAIQIASRGSYLIESNTFFDNFTAFHGGAIAIEQSGYPQPDEFTSIIRKNLFNGNTATGGGGAVYIFYESSVPTILENNTFYANQTSSIGGAILTEGRTEIRNNTFANNQAARAGGDAGASLFLYGAYTTLYNNIFANNTGGKECASPGYNVNVAGNNNLIEDGSGPCSTLPGTIIADPLLGPLANNGGLTQTIALLPGSPAIDAGDNTNCPETDQRGMARSLDGNNDGSVICDVGAYEFGYFTISGNAGVPEAILSYFDGTAKTITADNNGDYSFAVLVGWSGVVTPYKSGYIFSPASKTYSNVTADQLVEDYTATVTDITFAISGNVGAAGATLSYEDETLKTVVADENGEYSFTVPYNWIGTVTPTKTDYQFVPGNINYFGVQADQSAQDYKAIALVTISGNAGIEGATLNYVDGSAKVAIADGSGDYSFQVPENWSGTVIPEKMAYSFVPTSRTYTNVTSSKANENYTATPTTYTISGNVGLSGVFVEYYTSYGISDFVLSDTNGSYSIAVPQGWSGHVSPYEKDHTFSPTGREYVNVINDKSNEDYAPLANPYTISGNTGVGEVEVTYSLNYSTKTITSDENGNYSFTVWENWSGVVTPYKQGYLFTPARKNFSNVQFDQPNQDFIAQRVYLVSGNAGLAGAILNYTIDGLPKAVIADGLGNYSIQIPEFWSGTIAPSKAGHIFSPLSYSYANVIGDQTDKNYTATPTNITFVISGNTGVGGVGLSYSEGLGTSIENGNYSLVVPYGWSGTVTPSKSGYRFTPGSKNYVNVQAHQTSKDYIPTRIFTVAGNVGVGGATLSYTENDILKTVTASSNGSYSFQVDEGWTGIVTPSKANVTFTPTSRSYEIVQSDQSAQNYSAVITVINQNNGGLGSLRQAITDAVSGATIKFEPALAGQTITLSSQLDINKDLMIDGSGLDPRVTISGNKVSRVFQIDDGVIVRLQSLVLKDGKTEGTSYSSYGSAVQVGHNTQTIIEKVAFIGNTAPQGGAIAAFGRTNVIISESEFLSNSAMSGSGGAIYFQIPDLTVTKTSFANNSAGSGSGGAIYLKDSGKAVFEENVFESNIASLGGGAISSNNVPGIGLDIKKNLFANNSAGSGSGGAIRITRLSSASVILENNTFYGNQALTYGGAVSSEAGMEIRNNTFSNNQANNGGASVRLATNSVNKLYNNIFANSTGGIECLPASLPIAPAGNNNLVEDASGVCSALPGTIVSDPMLGSLADNGGATQTMALLPGSPAIDTGDDLTCISTDQRGVSRPQGSHCDIGAYEYDGTDSTVKVFIGTTEMDSYPLIPNESMRKSYPGKNGGPVKISNTGGFPITAAERVIYKVNGINTSFSEMMGLPSSQVDQVYWLPWYNSKTLNTQIRIANVSNAEAEVHVTIGGVEMTGSPFTIPVGGSVRKTFPDIDKGPVLIESDQAIVAAERVIYRVNGVDTSFSEMMALPASQVDTTYWLPWYNSKTLNTQLRIANVSGMDASVHVTIGGTEVLGSPFTIPVGGSVRKTFPNVDKGPVLIESDQDIVAAERVIYNVNGVDTSFTEMMAMPASQLDTTYWLPWYNSKTLDTQLRIANVSNAEAEVHVTIGGTEVTGSPFTILAGESKRLTFPNIDRGPVKIESDPGESRIVAAERVIYRVSGVDVSFSEMMALPDSLLDTLYWLPWYNNKELDTQLRFGVP